MSNLIICSKCGAPIESTKCQFCGSSFSHDIQNENSSNQKLIAEREFENGNYKAALKEYETFYKQNPNDSYTIIRRAECLFELEEINLSQFSNYLNQAIEIAKTPEFNKYVVELFIENTSYKIDVQSLDCIGFIYHLFKLCEQNTELLDFAVSKLIKEICNTEDYINNYEDFVLLLIYDSVNALAREITVGTSRKSGFETSKEFDLCKNIICKLSTIDKGKWQNVYDFEDDMVSSPDYKFDLAPLYVLDKIDCSFVGKIAHKYIQSYFSNSRRWYDDDQWIEGIDKIPKDITNIEIINVLNKQVNEVLSEKEKPFKYVFPEGIKKIGIGPIGGKGNCFIATATMGSYDHPVVIDLRIFRDNWLLKRKWGKVFTRWYYTHGPKVAKFIERSYILKIVAFIIVVKPLHILTNQVQKRIHCSKRLQEIR